MISPDDLATLPGARVVRPGSARSAGGSPEQALGPVTADSRAARPGSVFFALQGVRDGHEFLPAAVEAGAAAVVVERAEEVLAPVYGRDDVLVVEVPDTLRALQDLATAVRRRSPADAVAITGSVGKTTTKALVSAALASRPAVVSSPKSFNNHLGVPLTVLGLGPGTTDLVAEIGTNHPGEIAGLVRIVGPRVGVVTNVGYAHVGNFGTREELAREKASLLTGVREDGVWVVNSDDPLLMAAVAELDRPAGTRVVRIGTGADADVRISRVEVGEDATTARVELDGVGHDVRVPLVGRHFATAAATALLVATERGVPVEQAVADLAAVGPLEGRGTVSRARDGRVRVVDDSYNGSPDSTLAALATLEVLPEPRRVAVLGEMRELGEWTETLHRAVGERVATAATDLVFVGPSFAIVADAATGAGMPASRITAAASATEAAGVLEDLLAADPDASFAVLLKASRFVHMERVALRLEGVEVGCTRGLCELYIHCRDCPLLLTG